MYEIELLTLLITFWNIFTTFQNIPLRSNPYKYRSSFSLKQISSQLVIMLSQEHSTNMVLRIPHSVVFPYSIKEQDHRQAFVLRIPHSVVFPVLHKGTGPQTSSLLLKPLSQSIQRLCHIFVLQSYAFRNTYAHFLHFKLRTYNPPKLKVVEATQNLNRQIIV